jgi:DNA invertase Pin-like site-specific DNA recombinase
MRTRVTIDTRRENAMTRKARVGLYVRVSTNEQNTEGQETELKEYAKRRGWEVAKIYRDMMSGVKNSRPALDELMADARRGKLGVVLVWRFDRFARSVSHLLSALEEFRALGVEFVSVREQIDTSTPTGKMVFTVLGAVAELERSLIGERVRMGVQNARKKGKQLGRPPIRRLTAAEIETAKSDRAIGKFSLRQLARKYGTSLWAMQQTVSGRGAAA